MRSELVCCEYVVVFDPKKKGDSIRCGDAAIEDGEHVLEPDIGDVTACRTCEQDVVFEAQLEGETAGFELSMQVKNVGKVIAVRLVVSAGSTGAFVLACVSPQPSGTGAFGNPWA
jgi:hypothetical protein